MPLRPPICPSLRTSIPDGPSSARRAGFVAAAKTRGLPAGWSCVPIAANVMTRFTPRDCAYSMTRSESSCPCRSGCASPRKMRRSCCSFGSFHEKKRLRGRRPGEVIPSSTSTWLSSKNALSGSWCSSVGASSLMRIEAAADPTPPMPGQAATSQGCVSCCGVVDIVLWSFGFACVCLCS